MLYSIYGNCQADALSVLLHQSPKFCRRYQLARLPACFLITEDEARDWAATHAPEVRLLITQKLRKGWREGKEVFDTDWLAARCAPNARRFQWSDMHYAAYEPHMTYPVTFYRLPPTDYVNLLHLLTFAGGLDWQRLAPFYSDPTLFPQTLVQAAHERDLAELARREAGCNVQIAPFIAERWRSERLFLTFNHPGRAVMRHAANQILAGVNVARPLPETGAHGFDSASGLPLLAAFDAALSAPERRGFDGGFYIGDRTVDAASYFGQWEASLTRLGREAARAELAAQIRNDPIKREILTHAARHLGVDLPG